MKLNNSKILLLDFKPTIWLKEKQHLDLRRLISLFSIKDTGNFLHSFWFNKGTKDKSELTVFPSLAGCCNTKKVTAAAIKHRGHQKQTEICMDKFEKMT